MSMGSFKGHTLVVFKYQLKISVIEIVRLITMQSLSSNFRKINMHFLHFYL